MLRRKSNSTTKLEAFFETLLNDVRPLGVSGSKGAAEKAFNGNLFGMESKQDSNNDKKVSFYVFLQICKPCFSPYTSNDEHLRFSSIICFQRLLSYFYFFLKARNKLTQIYIKFLVKQAEYLVSRCTNLMVRNKLVQPN